MNPVRLPNNLRPYAGMFVQAYWYHRGIGGGIRSFMVIHVGRKYVDLIYPPKLLKVRLTWPEWAALALVGDQQGIMRDKEAFVKRLQATANQYARLGIRFNQDTVRKAIEICGGRYATPKELAEREQ